MLATQQIAFVFVQPADNAVVPSSHPFEVSGRVTDVGRPEPHLVDSVTVQVDNGPVVRASLTRIHDQTQSLVAFSAFVTVTGGHDPHTLTVIATDDAGQSVAATRHVFTNVPFAVDAPAVVVDLLSFVPFDEATILSQTGAIQDMLLDLSASLGALGKVLAGPNFQFTIRPEGQSSHVRVGFWIEDRTFPVIAPVPPGRPLPLVPTPGADAGFHLVPAVPVSTNLASFAVITKPGLLQQLVDAMAPDLKNQTSQQGVSVDSITVQPSSPANVKTHVTGTLPAAVPFDMTITETLGVVKAPDQINHAPAVIRSSHSSGLGNILDVIAAVVLGPFRNILVAEFLELRSKTADTDTQITGMMQSLLEGVPLHYPFNRKNFFKDSSSVADFPVLITDWQTFGVLGERLVGTGLTTLHPREQADAGLSISGPTTISGFQGEMDLVSKQTYTFSLSDLAPDPNGFRWTISGLQSSAGTIDSPTLAQSGSFTIVFPLPRNIKVGNWAYKLAVNAVETCGRTGSTAQLTASASLDVVIQVKPNPRH
jgi:hypothetical protein